MWHFPPYRLDAVNQHLWRDDVRIPVMPKPFAVLQYLVGNAGRLIGQEELLQAIWPDTHVQPDILRRYILEVRRALGDDAETPRFIETLPKRGYRFIASVTEHAEPDPLLFAGDRRSVFVGREGPLTELDECFQKAAEGKRQIVFVSGEAGIGKTSLLQAFERKIRAIAGVQVTLGQCIEGFDGKEPYYPVLEAIGRLLRGSAKNPVADALTSVAPTWMMQFPVLMRAGQEAELQRRILSVTRNRMVREFCDALESITQHAPLILLLEDLHWTDNSTLDLLSAIARRREAAKLLVIGTIRPVDLLLSESPLKGLKQALLSHHLAREVTLEGLGRGDVDAYLAAEFQGGALAGDFGDMIHRRSEGNPLFMTAIIDHLTQTGVLHPGDGGWKLSNSVDRIDPGVPESLHQMLELELGHLNDDERQLLKSASVAGQQFTICSVAIMLEITYDEAEKRCALLAERHQFLKNSGTCELPSGILTVQYEFRHSLYRDALYRGLAIPQRVNLHRALAAGMIGYESPGAPVLAAKIAMHFEEGRQWEQAIRHYLMAAQTASRRYAHREALAICEHARELLSHTSAESRFQLERDVLTRVADIQYTLGEMETSISTYELLVNRAVQAGDAMAEAEALMAMSHPASFIDPPRAIDVCEQAAKVSLRLGQSKAAAQAQLLASCWRILIHGWSDDAERNCDAAVSTLLESGAELPAYGRLLWARVLVYRSRYEQAIENAIRAIEDLTGGDSLWAAPAAFYAKASALGHLGRLGDSYETLAKGFELAKKDNNAEWLGALRYTFFWLKWHVFDVEGMREIASSIAETGASGLSVQMRIQLSIAQGYSELATEQYETARQRFEAILNETGEAMLLWRTKMFARRGLSEAWLSLGEFSNARREADELIASIGDTRDHYMAAFAWEYSARLALASGRGNPEQDITRSLESVRKAEIPVAAWRVHATAWDVYRNLNPARAEAERQHAESIILQIAKSLDGLPSLLDCFLAARPVRRVLDASSEEAAHKTTAKP